MSTDADPPSTLSRGSSATPQRPRQIHGSEQENLRITKVAIVVIVFPVLVELMYILIGYPVLFVLSPLVAHLGRASDVVAKVIVGLLFIAEVAAAFSVCRLVWPKPRVGPVDPRGANAGR